MISTRLSCRYLRHLRHSHVLPLRINVIIKEHLLLLSIHRSRGRINGVISTRRRSTIRAHCHLIIHGVLHLLLIRYKARRGHLWVLIGNTLSLYLSSCLRIKGSIFFILELRYLLPRKNMTRPGNLLNIVLLILHYLCILVSFL
jgi:hypothetical protein